MKYRQLKLSPVSSTKTVRLVLCFVIAVRVTQFENRFSVIASRAKQSLTLRHALFYPVMIGSVFPSPHRRVFALPGKILDYFAPLARTDQAHWPELHARIGELPGPIPIQSPTPLAISCSSNLRQSRMYKPYAASPKAMFPPSNAAPPQSAPQNFSIQDSSEIFRYSHRKLRCKDDQENHDS